MAVRRMSTPLAPATNSPKASPVMLTSDIATDT